MELFSCSARWTPKGCRKARGVYAYVFANSREEAIEKLKGAIQYPTDLYVDFMAFKVKGDVIVTRYF
jgi:hypothetical protein